MPTTPKSLRASLAVLAVGAAALAYSLVRLWGANPEYVDRFLILAGAAYIVWEAWPALRATSGHSTPLGYVTVREFARDSASSHKAGRETDRQLILYWTQEGRHIWTESDERRAQHLGSHDWLGERLFSREQATQTGRIVVLLGMRLWGDGTTIRKQTLELAGQVAVELYRVCPWAAPTAPLAARRKSQRERRLAVGGSGACTRQTIRRGYDCEQAALRACPPHAPPLTGVLRAK